MSIQELLDRIRHGSFPASQRLVAVYVLENYHQVPFLTISALAERIGVSNNTIVKFCHSLGYEKYTEFKKVLSDYAHSELIMLNKLSETDELSGGDDALITQELETDLANIRSTLSDPHNREALRALPALVDRAGHIYVTGGRASAAMASLLTNELRYLGLRVHDISLHSGDHLDTLSMVERDDLLIALTFPRYTAATVQELRLAHERGVPIVAITDTGLSPALPYASLSFHCAAATDSYFTTNYAGCLALINLICRTLAAAQKKRAMAHTSRLERLLLEQNIFE